MIEFASWAKEAKSQGRIHHCDGAAASFVNDIHAISQRSAAPTVIFSTLGASDGLRVLTAPVQDSSCSLALDGALAC